MKKFFSIVCAAALVFAIASCSKTDNSKVLKIGATPEPHAKILEKIKDNFKAAGYDLKIVEFEDYSIPNDALLSGEIDANFFQHVPYLEANTKWESLVPAFGVHVEPFGLYSQKYSSLDEIPVGADIAIPNDPTNGGRALLLLQAAGLIKLREDAGLEATDIDIVENPRNIRIQMLDAAQLPRILPDVGAAAINGNYALQASLVPSKDALILEGADAPYVNVVVVRKGDENDPRIVALRKVLLSDTVRDYIVAEWPDGNIVPVF
ncbi:MAG: methionine ABC transporter substrate-binding protein [Spirochaetaceae bacterium]|jgi:D-methionine transport system substrate-binding protein|nr:methionine ABC transporter substrate-binding protein [Spirochaetaceae bacterium]